MAEPRRAYDDKLALILRTAAEIFADKGYHDTSIRDISRATAISRSGLYYRRTVNAKKKEYTELCMTVLAELEPTVYEAERRAAAFSLFGIWRTADHLQNEHVGGIGKTRSIWRTGASK